MAASQAAQKHVDDLQGQLAVLLGAGGRHMGGVANASQ